MVVKTSVSKTAAKEDPCGILKELYKSANLSISHVEVTGEAKKHMHKNTEEVYYVEKGKVQLVIGDEVLDMEAGELVPIPQNTWHYLRKADSGERPMVIVVTHPGYDPSDMIFEA